MKTLLSLLVWMLIAGPAHAFDHGHPAWDALLKTHVVVINDGGASQVRYAGFQNDRQALTKYLETLSAVTEAEFAAFTRQERLAFLINAYNAFTVQLVLSEYPDLESIKDLGSLLTSPWKKEFFTLLGQRRHLDNIEHDMIRAPGTYDDPRIHVAVVCASIGCPAMRKEAYVGVRLDAQLDDSLRRFLSDRSRNRFNSESKTLEVSKIFDWYRKDFEKGHQGFQRIGDVFARYADRLADAPADRELIRARKAQVTYLEYDWKLNDVTR